MATINLSLPIVLHVQHPMWPCTAKQCFVRELPQKTVTYRSLRFPQLAAPVPIGRHNFNLKIDFVWYRGAVGPASLARA
jgi:hypothetical protein